MTKNKHSKTTLVTLVVLSSFFTLSLVIGTSAAIHESIVLRNLAKQELTVSEIESKNYIFAKIFDAIDYASWMNETGKYFDENGVVRSSLNEDDLTSVSEKFASIKEPYKEEAAKRMELLNSERVAMKTAIDTVNSLFTSTDRSEVRDSIIRSEYDDALAKVNSLKQENLKNHLAAEMEKALPVIEEKERIARERAEAERRAREEEQRKIAASWHRLELPRYINQFDAGYLNGCEAASVLMAASYKGRLTGYSFSAFADGMPTASNPNNGFYLSMKEGRNGGPAHWIAPGPLAAYANSKGAGVINATGSSLDQLDAEVAAGNPVVIYLTYRYANPIEYHNGVPDNLHVVVLTGYNSYTGQQVFYDPAPVAGTIVTLSKSRAEYLYAASGHRALVVK